MIGKFLNEEPRIDETSFIACGSKIIGAVKIGKHSSIWYNVVVRADINTVKIGDYTNIQDGTVIHVEDDKGVHIGDHVTVGHSAIIHACRIGDHSLIGMGAIVLNGAEIGKGSKVAAGAVVCEGFKVRENSLVMGVPARIARELTEEERKENIYWAEKYSKLCSEFKEGGR